MTGESRVAQRALSLEYFVTNCELNLVQPVTDELRCLMQKNS